VVSVCALSCCFSAFAQEDVYTGGSKPDTMWLDISSTVGRVAHSLYNRLEIIDKREDTSEVGWFSNGTYYGLEVCLAGTLNQQLGRLLGQLTDSSAGDGTLVVEMRRFVAYDNDKKRSGSLRFRVFGGKGGRYCRIADVDTTFSQRLGTGRGGQRKFSAAMNGALSVSLASLLRRPGDSAAGLFTVATIPFADQLWKGQTPLYQTDVFPDGVYLRYSSFARLRPDITQFEVTDTVNPEKGILLAATKEDPSMQVNPGQIFGFVSKGKAYVTFDEAFQPLIKKDGDYFVIGRMRADAPDADVVAGLAGFALAVASMGKLPFVHVWGLTVRKKFLLQLDYGTGRFVPVRPVG
jgi:hypothetical protein